MPTTKARIQVSMSRDIERTLDALATRDQVPSATKAAELLRLAIEIEEDEVLDAIATSRDKKRSTFISHEEVWK